MTQGRALVQRGRQSTRNSRLKKPLENDSGMPSQIEFDGSAAIDWQGRDA